MSVKYTNFCRSFLEEACHVWEEMSEAGKLGIPRQEETTTELLLLSLARKHKGHGLDIKAFTRSDETSNGADWAFWFSNDRHLGIELRVQAKRLYASSGRYDSLFHQSQAQREASRKAGTETPNQCDALINNRGSAIPIYVFYNSDALQLTPMQVMLAKFAKIGVPVYRETWGISVASAYSVKAANWGKRNAPDDFPNVPWHILVCTCFWPDRAADPSLPSQIGNGLRNLFRMDGGSDFEETNFDPHDNRPAWVGLLGEVEFARDDLIGLMEEQNLQGVVEIAERPIDE